MGSKNGNRKHGRNEGDCKRYAAEYRAEKSKARKIARHLKSAPWDAIARQAFDGLPALAKSGVVLPPLAKSPTHLRREEGITLSRAA